MFSMTTEIYTDYVTFKTVLTNESWRNVINSKNKMSPKIRINIVFLKYL